MSQMNTSGDTGIIKLVRIIEVGLGNNIVHKCILKRDDTSGAIEQQENNGKHIT